MANELAQFSQAVLNGAQAGGVGSYIPEVAQAMAGRFNLGGIERAGNAMGTAAAQIADDEEKRRKAARDAELSRLQDMVDPSKYQKLRKDDGGFAFFSPDGKEIDVDTYAKRTGQRRVDVLKDSENPVDQQFIDDYLQMNELNQAIWRNDSATVQEAMTAYPDLFRNGTAPTPEQLNKKLLEKYPHMFGMGNYETSFKNLGAPIFRVAGTSSGGSSSGGRRSNLSL